MIPLKIKVADQSQLSILWDDNSESIINLERLRKFCPCAVCMDERSSQSNSYIPLFHSAQKRIKKISMVGKYAIGIHWEDGHNTGIYDYQFLKNLSKD